MSRLPFKQPHGWACINPYVLERAPDVKPSLLGGETGSSLQREAAENASLLVLLHGYVSRSVLVTLDELTKRHRKQCTLGSAEWIDSEAAFEARYNHSET